MGAAALCGQQNEASHFRALGQKQTSRHLRIVSALPPKPDIAPHGVNVRFVQIVAPGLAAEVMSSQADFAKFLVDFTEKWRNVIHAANIKPE
jgi:hypothetical protein